MHTFVAVPVRSSLSRIEPLEARIAPAAVFALDGNKNLLRFDSATPGTISATVAISGLAGGPAEALEGIDFRPATGQLYALGVVDAGAADEVRIYVVNPSTGVAKQVGSGFLEMTDGVNWGFDFNPASDRIRVTNDGDENARINPNNGARADDPINDGDLAHPTESESITAVAYLNNFSGTTTTTLYGINYQTDELVIHNPPNTGTLVDVGPLGFTTANSSIGFDIRSTLGGNEAYASMAAAGPVYNFYTINLATGAATVVGAIGNGATAIRDIALPVAAVTIVNATTATYTDADGDLVTIKTTKGTLDALDFVILAPAEGGVAGGGLLRTVTISDDESAPGVKAFAGAKLTFTATRGPLGGDGLMSVDFINATGVNLAAVTVDGDLHYIQAGAGMVNGVLSTAIGALTVHSMGAHEHVNTSVMAGHVGTLKVITDMRTTLSSTVAGSMLKSAQIGGSLAGNELSGSARLIFHSIGTVKILGDLRAGTGDESGKIQALTGNIGSIFVGGSVLGARDTLADTVAQIQAAGDIGSITIGRNLVGYDSELSGQITALGKIGAMKVGGSVVGGDGVSSAGIRADGGIGTLTIGRDVRAGNGDESTKIFSGGAMKSLTIGGDFIGAAGAYNTNIMRVGHFNAASVGSLVIRGDLEGGTDSFSGHVRVAGAVKSILIGGSIHGGSSESTGRLSIGQVGTVLVGGDVVGGSGTNSGGIGAGSPKSIKIGGNVEGGNGPNSGMINSNGRIASLTIGRDLRGGSAMLNVSGVLLASSFGSITIGGDIVSGVNESITFSSVAIHSSNEIASLTVKGSILGNDTHPVVIVARGATTPNPAKNSDLAIGKITIGGSVHRADILGGHADYFNPLPQNGDAQIGAVSVKGNWSASNLIAGSQDGADNLWGTGDDAAGPNDDAAITSRIASIVIGGRVTGTTASGDHFGFVAQRIGSLKVAGVTFPIAVAPTLRFDIGTTFDVSAVLHA